MTTLNKRAAEVITEGEFRRVHAVTDVTGFGLIGHAREMALASNVSFRLHAGSIPLLRRRARMRTRRIHSRGPQQQSRLRRVPGGL